MIQFKGTKMFLLVKYHIRLTEIRKKASLITSCIYDIKYTISAIDSVQQATARHDEREMKRKQMQYLRMQT